MEFVWDEAKRRANLAKHGLDFADASRFDWAGCYYLQDDVIEGEVRFRAVGFLGGRIVTVVGTQSGETIRLISLRKATKGERDGY